ncbi:MAG: hypothetical protein WBX81_11965, partial [Nitrososphaeraceae archaeon]
MLHTISSLELFVLNFIASKFVFPELQKHSLAHCKFSYLLLWTNPRYSYTGSFYLDYRYNSNVHIIAVEH